MVGANNAGKSTVWESFDAIARKAKSDVSFSAGRRNRQSADGIRLTLRQTDGSTYVVKSIHGGTSETEAHWEGPAAITPPQIEIVAVPARRQFQASFSKNVTPQRDWMNSSPDFSRNQSRDQFSGRLFDLHSNPAKKALFDELMTEVIGSPFDWTIDLNDGQNYGQYYLRVTTAEGVDHTSEGLGDGIISLLFILNALYDSDPETLLVLDEPELSLHPQLVRRLGRVIARFAATRQIVVFTHSPYLVSWDDIEAGAEIARVFKVGGDSRIAQAKRATLDEISRARGGWRNPHVLGVDANAALFLDDKVIVVEGQEESLAEGITTATDGAKQLAAGTSSAASGAQTLSDGLTQLNTQAGTLPSGIAQLTTGTTAAREGASTLTGGLQQLSTGTNALATGSATAATSADTLATGMEQLAVAAPALVDGVGNLSDGLDQLLAGYDTLTEEQRKALLTQLASGAATLDEKVTGLDTRTATLATGARALAGSAQDGTGLAALAAGAAQVDTGAQSAASGAATLTTGLGTLSAGLTTLGSGATTLTTAIGPVSDGATPLSDGLTQLEDGAAALSSGLADAAEQIPGYDENERTQLATVTTTPVETSSSSDAATLGGTAVALAAALALWLGSLATFIVRRPIRPDAFGSRRNAIVHTLRGYWPAGLLGIVQGLLVAIGLQFALTLDAGAWFSLAASAMLAGAVFAAINQALVALLRGAGRYLSVLLAVVGIAGGVLTAVPAIITTIAAATPLQPGTDLIGAAIADAWAPATITGLIGWGILALAVTTLAVARKRTVPVSQLRALSA